ncbi:MAG: hypothetical protein ACP5NQ_06570, partial [Vulcanisaeta sp.]
MEEPILRLKPIIGFEFGGIIVAIIVTGAMWYMLGYLAPLQYHITLWEFALIQVFFILILVLEIRELIKDIKERSKYIKNFILYKDYAWFVTRNGDEVTIPIEDFNPCVTDYAPPYRTQPGRYTPRTYYSGRVWLRISHDGEDYILLIDTEQCRRLNQILN